MAQDARMDEAHHPSHGRKSVEKILICAAIRMEGEAIAKALGLKWDKSDMSAKGANVELALVGVRACRIPRDAKCDLLICAGLAGALDPSLQVGDVIIDAQDAIAVEAARFGRIYCADSVVSTPEQKAQLYKETSALAVDMESTSLANFARERSAKFANIRAISDTAQQAVDPVVLGLVDPFGRPKTGAVLSTLIRRPRLIPHLMHLRSRSMHACDRLGAAVAAYV
jgi:nucleoside phosphorylase